MKMKDETDGPFPLPESRAPAGTLFVGRSRPCSIPVTENLPSRPAVTDAMLGPKITA